MDVLEVIANVLDYFDTVILDPDARTVTPMFPDVTNEAKAKEICAALNRNYAGAPQLHITDQQRTLAAWMARTLAAEQLLKEALFLGQNGERPPGAPRDDPSAETWGDWFMRVEVALRALDEPDEAVTE